MEYLLQILRESSAVAMAIVFVYYLIRHGKNDADRDNLFTSTINNFDKTMRDYLKESIASREHLATELEKLAGTNKEMRVVLEKVYKHSRDVSVQNEKFKECIKRKTEQS